jgi:hypothetical protein
MSVSVPLRCASQFIAAQRSAARLIAAQRSAAQLIAAQLIAAQRSAAQRSAAQRSALATAHCCALLQFLSRIDARAKAALVKLKPAAADARMAVRTRRSAACSLRLG